MDKKLLTEQDIRTKFITPALLAAGWDRDQQLREDVGLTAGRIRVRSNNMHARDKQTVLRADYVLYHKSYVPLAVVEAKDNKHPIGSGMQQALQYAVLLDVPFAYSSNGDGFIEHDLTQENGVLEREIGLHEFPSPQELWRRYCRYKGLEAPAQVSIASHPYYQSATSFEPRYYQAVAINRVVEAVAKGATRMMLVMATGTGKTQTAFQIIHRLWRAGAKKRILYLADRNVLLDQPYRKDFTPFGEHMTWVKSHQINKAYEIYLALYQGLTSTDPDAQAYREFSPGFFDLIVVDECHRGSAAVDSAWRAILDYFPTATHLGLTATPREDAERSNADYFGAPIYTYSLKQGIADGFLAPYKVMRVQLDRDEGWRPEQGHTDAGGQLVPDREYNRADYDRTLVLGKRTEAVARRVTEFLKATDRNAKTIVFCRDREHAGRMRSALINLNQGMVQQHPHYVMQLTGEQPNIEGWVEAFTDPKTTYPVIATTSQLLTTGVDTKTVKVIVLDAPIASVTQFKQIIGRGTRIDEDHGKAFFTILDFHHATRLFADPLFDGEPDNETEVLPGQPIRPGGGEDDNPAQPPSPGGPRPGSNGGDDDGPGPQGKIYVNDVSVDILRERKLYYTPDGKLITESLQDYTRQRLRGKYAELDVFIARWRAADTTRELQDELEQQGLLLDELREEAARPDLDLFDLLCHVAYDAPPRTRRERAEQVRRRDYFTRFGEPARQVLNLLLDKYTQHGPDDLEAGKVLQLAPFDALETPAQLVKRFGGRPQFETALKELMAGLYAA
ncbi:DEAD/DEAH box helicase family protein [Hymenobacter sp. BT523]|uniref:EcoAI/FtnUII family type I restriction enzme subunit R n=1 Tax=Hymenobacter sp. BT523 TaxID=2795725 RepID=UPI0018EDA6F1|nr:DEAD/DEAH box helicase family protein [Hymenobacter sp. BT523]MBJ6111788.1 DEAD/DEAH box helicase family protein [Hymenobacter sp. BT523]